MTAMHSRRFCFRRRLPGFEPVGGGELCHFGDLHMAGSRVSSPTRRPYGLWLLGGRNHSLPNFPEIVLPFSGSKRSFAPEKWPIRSQLPRQAIPRCGRKTAPGVFRGMAVFIR
jgi:hypothetical protein